MAHARGLVPGDDTRIPTTVGVVCHATRSVLADREGDESPATAVAVVCRSRCSRSAVAGRSTVGAVVCPPHKRGPGAVAGHCRRTAVTGLETVALPVLDSI